MKLDHVGVAVRALSEVSYFYSERLFLEEFHRE